MATHSELNNRKLELEELVDKYSKENNITELENALLELVHTYGWLCFYEEDGYLEELVNTHSRLADLYIMNKNDTDALNSYINMIEGYDDLIQRDRNEKELVTKHIDYLKITYSKAKDLFDSLGVKDNLKYEYPRIRKYLD